MKLAKATGTLYTSIGILVLAIGAAATPARAAGSLPADPASTRAFPIDLGTQADVSARQLLESASRGNPAAQALAAISALAITGPNTDLKTARQFAEKSRNAGSALGHLAQAMYFADPRTLVPTMERRQVADLVRRAAAMSWDKDVAALKELYGNDAAPEVPATPATDARLKAGLQTLLPWSAHRMAYQLLDSDTSPDTQRVAADLLKFAAEQGNTASMIGLGDCLFSGVGVTKDLALARQWYEKSAAADTPLAFARLGFLYQNGQGIPKDLSKAEEYYLAGASRNDPSSVSGLGLLLLGKTDEASNRDGLRWLKRAFELGQPRAALSLASAYMQPSTPYHDTAAAKEWVMAGAKAGDTRAMTELASLYGRGNLFDKDFAQARHWYAEAARLGDSTGLAGLGKMHQLGDGGPKNIPEARRYFLEAAGKGNAWAMLELGLMEVQGSGNPENWEEARQWWLKAANAGSGEAAYRYGWTYWSGKGIARDDTTGLSWLRKAAENGHLQAAHDVGMAYYRGIGVAKDNAEALRWYRLAAERGHADSMNNIGNRYFRGEGVEQDYAQAIAWFQKAAEKGSAAALGNLGAAYAEGKGIPQNFALARTYHEQAAARGLVGAYGNVAAFYLQGKGVPRDLLLGAEWLRRGAEKGDPAAMNNYGVALRDGQGTMRNTGEACKWFEQAAYRKDLFATLNIANCHLKGWTDPADPRRARAWLLVARDLLATKFASVPANNRVWFKNMETETLEKLTQTQQQEAAAIADAIRSRLIGEETVIPPNFGKPPTPPGATQPT